MPFATRQILEHHAKALADGNIAAIMADYADDAVLVMLDRNYVGKAAVQEHWTNGLAAFNGGKLTPLGLGVHGNLALTTWSFASSAVTIPVGVDSYVIRNDKIAQQTCYYTVVPKGA